MNNERFTFLKGVRAMALVLFALCAMGVSNANASCVCSANPTVSLSAADADDPCTKMMTVDALAGCDGVMKVTLVEPNEHVHFPFTTCDGTVYSTLASYNASLPVDASVAVSIPGKYKYEIEGACWNYFTAEDKNGPICDNTDQGDCYYDDKDAGKDECYGKQYDTDDDLYLKPVILSCTYTGEIDPLMATLERNDYKDCTGIDQLYSKDYKFEFCPFTREMSKEAVDYFNGSGVPTEMWQQVVGIAAGAAMEATQGWQICEIGIRVHTASDYHGNVSPISLNCIQAWVVLRPSPYHVFIPWSAEKECNGDDISQYEDNFEIGAPYFLDLGPEYCGTQTDKKNDREPYFILPGDHGCKYGVSYDVDDTPLYTCTDDYASCADNKSTGKIVRRITVIDWCYTDDVLGYSIPNDLPLPLVGLGGLPVTQKATGTQIIEIVDTEKPELDIETSFWPDPFDCTFTLRVEAESTDDCSSAEHEIYVEYSTSAHGGGSFARKGPFTADNFDVPGIPLDADVTVTGSAWDCCGNKVDMDPRVGKPTDIFAPVCISNDELEVSLIQTDHSEDADADHSIGARIKAEDLDDTSHDPCSEITLEVRDPKAAAGTANASFGPFVEYEWTTSEFEAATEGTCLYEVWVELRVTDAAGNSSTCNTLLKLRDESAPRLDFVCIDRSTRTERSTYRLGRISSVSRVSCLDKMPDFKVQNVWGACATATTTPGGEKFHCPTTVYICNEAYYNIVEVKYLTTTASKVNEHSNPSISTTEVILISEGFEEKFTFPIDYKVSCDAAGGINIPDEASLSDILTSSGCSDWKLSVTSRRLDGGNDGACYTIIRNYEFINECRWDGVFDEGERISKDCADTNGDGKLIGESPVRIGLSTVYGSECGYALYGSPSGKEAVRSKSDGDGHAFYKGVIAGSQSSACQAVAYNAKDKQYEWVTTSTGRAVNTTRNYSDRRMLANGYFNYSQIIKVFDDVAPTATITSDAGCGVVGSDPSFPTDDPGCFDGWVKFTVDGTDLCSNASLEDWYINEPGNKANFTRDGNMFVGTGLAKGEYELHVNVADDCGNNIWATAIDTVMWDDCKAPTIVCVPGFTAVMENATVEVWASELVVSLSDNCATEEDLQGRLHIVAINADTNDDGQIDGGDAPAAPADLADWNDAVTLSCADFGYVNRAVAIYTRDNEGNDQFCTTFVSLQAGTSSPAECAGGDVGGGDVASLLGEIKDENGEMVGDVTVTVRGSGFSTFADIFTGNFSFSVPMNSDASISPSKDRGHLNGVGTADLVALQRHILGISTLTSAYKIIAADVTNDQEVDARDMLHISRLVLGIYSELPNVDAWSFVDRDHVFANPTSPWGYPTAVDYATLGAEMQANFIGVKMGDLTGNASPINLLGDDATTNGEMTIAIDDAKIAAGTSRTIEFTAKDFNDFAGYQFSIQLADGVSFEGFELGSLPNHTEANFGLSRVNEGIITTNWATANSIDLEDGAVLFTLTVGASSDIDVSSAIEVNSVVTPAEAYNNGLEVFDVHAQFSKTETAFELFQNTPNPFSNETIIGFNLPEAGAASLKVMDVSGRTLKAINGTYTAGFHQVSIAKSDLGATGVLYYQLDTQSGSATKKMIILE